VPGGFPSIKIFVAENWADGREIVPAPFEEGPLVVHYSAPSALAHEQHTIAEVIAAAPRRSSLPLLFVVAEHGVYGWKSSVERRDR